MNNKIFYFFHSFAHQSTFNDGLIVFFAETLPYFVIVFAVLFVLLHHDVVRSKKPFALLKQKWQEIIFVFLSSVIAWVLAYILKSIFMTPRPFLALSEVTPLWIEGGYAFPSGHSTAFMALAVSIFLCHKKVGYAFIGFAILIGIARIMAGVHFPIDILGGFILGAGVAYTIKFLQK
ncbi:MAG: phosphatase PAP2 family protein [Patescibacteria group bacterium]